MTRWLLATRQVSGSLTKPTKPTEPPTIPLPQRVVSVKSVLSAGMQTVLLADCPLEQKQEIALSASDPETYLDHLRLHGPTTYGAAATALGWGATRAWQAEARLRAAGLVRYDALGKAHPVAK